MQTGIVEKFSPPVSCLDSSWQSVDSYSMQDLSEWPVKKRDSKKQYKATPATLLEDEMVQSSNKTTSSQINGKASGAIDKAEKIKAQNKERAQKSRERKRRYTESLEMKIALLEKQVKKLTLDVDRYK